MTVKIAPSLLSCDFGRLADEARAAVAAGADYLHVDVMDGRFVPNLTLGPVIVEALHRAVPEATLDVHLMIEEPERYVEAFAKAGASIISVHAEACRHLHRNLQQLRSLGVKAAVALNPATPLSVLDYVLDYVDLVLVMTVNPGFGGQKFIEACLPKVRALSTEIAHRGLHVEIEVDGGIKPGTAAHVAAAGAGVLVAGSAVFDHPGHDYAAAIRALRDDAELGQSHGA